MKCLFPEKFCTEDQGKAHLISEFSAVSAGTKKRIVRKIFRKEPSVSFALPFGISQAYVWVTHSNNSPFYPWNLCDFSQYKIASDFVVFDIMILTASLPISH